MIDQIGKYTRDSTCSKLKKLKQWNFQLSNNNIDQRWLFVGSHPTERNPDPDDKKSLGYPEALKLK